MELIEALRAHEDQTERERQAERAVVRATASGRAAVAAQGGAARKAELLHDFLVRRDSYS